MVWLHLKVFRLSKDDSAGHSAKKNKERWEDNIKEWTRIDFANSTRAAEDRIWWERIVVKSFVVPERPHKVIG